MLREISSVRQTAADINNGVNKRWFSSTQLDLFIWQSFECDSIRAFQLSYDKQGRESAISWKENESAQFFEVDSGWEPGNYPKSPILLDQEQPDTEALYALVNEKLSPALSGIDKQIADFILATLDAAALTP